MATKVSPLNALGLDGKDCKRLGSCCKCSGCCKTFQVYLPSLWQQCSFSFALPTLLSISIYLFSLSPNYTCEIMFYPAYHRMNQQQIFAVKSHFIKSPFASFRKNGSWADVQRHSFQRFGSNTRNSREFCTSSDKLTSFCLLLTSRKTKRIHHIEACLYGSTFHLSIVVAVVVVFLFSPWESLRSFLPSSCRRLLC